MNQNLIVLCLGKKGQGKSYSIKRSLDKLGRHSALYVWDYNREYAGPEAKDGIRNAVVFRSWPAFLEAAAGQQGHLGRVVLQVGRERFKAFCAFVHRSGGCTVVLDELHDFVRPDQPENRAAFEELLTTSRHRRINVYAAAWRPTALPPCARQAADEVRAFHTEETTDLAWYRAAGCPENFVINLTRLPAKRSLVWRRGAIGLPAQGNEPHVEANPPDRGGRDRHGSDRRAGSRDRRRRPSVKSGKAFTEERPL